MRAIINYIRLLTKSDEISKISAEIAKKEYNIDKHTTSMINVLNSNNIYDEDKQDEIIGHINKNQKKEAKKILKDDKVDDDLITTILNELSEKKSKIDKFRDSMRRLEKKKIKLKKSPCSNFGIEKECLKDRCEWSGEKCISKSDITKIQLKYIKAHHFAEILAKKESKKYVVITITNQPDEWTRFTFKGTRTSDELNQIYTFIKGFVKWSIKEKYTSDISEIGDKQVIELTKIQRIQEYFKKLGRPEYVDNYSTVCQSFRQPTIMDDKALAKYKETSPNARSIKVHDINWVCPTEGPYIYPGIAATERSPYKLPCCYINEPKGIKEKTRPNIIGHIYTTNKINLGRYGSLVHNKQVGREKTKLVLLEYFFNNKKTLKVINPDNRKSIEESPYKFLRYGAVQGASSFIHAVLKCIDDEYYKKSVSKQRTIVNKMRNNIADNITPNIYASIS